MFYITYPQKEVFRELTFDDLFSNVQITDYEQLRMNAKGATRTYCLKEVTEKIRSKTDVEEMVKSLQAFNKQTENLHAVNRGSLYKKGFIPKKKGGLREINAPVPELKNALTYLQVILSGFMLADHHDAAYAYVRSRSTVEAGKTHQRRNNFWFAKFDLHDFFGSCDFDFIWNMFQMIYPFNLIVENEQGARELKTALGLCMLNNGLPQGSPISPWLTNVIMIPFDHILSKRLSDFVSKTNGRHYRFCYTRYADDMDISSKFQFDYHEIEHLIMDILKYLGAKFTLNQDKTEYGSRSGRNYILGIKLNKDNELGLGAEKNKQLEAKLTQYILSHGPCGFTGNYDPAKSVAYTLNDVQKLSGLISYYKMVNPRRTSEIISEYNRRFKVDIYKLIKHDLNNL